MWPGQKGQPEQRSGGRRDCLGSSAVPELDCWVKFQLYHIALDLSGLRFLPIERVCEKKVSLRGLV